MASGSFEHSFHSTLNPADCWAVLTDVDRLAGWVDIVSDVTVRDYLKSYGATLEDRIGPFRLRADLDISVTEARDGARIAFEATGQDRQVGSRLTIRAAMTLDPAEAGTTVRFDGTYAVEGRVATVGAPMIRRKADAVLAKFVTRAESELQ